MSGRSSGQREMQSKRNRIYKAIMNQIDTGSDNSKICHNLFNYYHGLSEEDKNHFVTQVIKMAIKYRTEGGSVYG